MTVSDHSSNRIYRTGSATVLSRSEGLSEGTAASAMSSTSAAAVPAPASWPWLRTALILALAAQVITIAALVGSDPIPASWAALLLAIAPGPLAAIAALPVARIATLVAPLTVVVLLVGIIGQITHTGLFFLPALVVMIVAVLKLWGER
jgi:hypothetical protein